MSPDGEFFVVVSAQGRLTYGRSSDGATLRTFFQCHARAVEFSRDGRLLACIGESNGCPARIKVWNVDDGKLLCRMQIKGGNDPVLSFSSDGLVLASTSGGSSVDFWQLPAGTLRSSVTTSQAISALAFSSDGHEIVAT
jgi:WD40 repeat protein